MSAHHVKLTENHKESTYEWAKEQVTWPLDDWKDVTFSEEKKLYVDDPDIIAHYCHDLRTKKNYFSPAGEAVHWSCY